MLKREYRFISELRAAVDGEKPALEGYAALFNHDSKNLGGFIERIAPGAFARSLKENADVKCLFNHDANRILGRTKSGTLTLSTDDRGLKFRSEINEADSNAVALYASVKRGDIDECSFAFTVAEGGQSWAEVNGDPNIVAVRTLTDVNLLDVSAVTYPAYAGTSVGARSEFPEGRPVEIRSALAGFIKSRVSEEERSEESFEDMLSDIRHSLDEKYPVVDTNGNVSPYGGRFYIVETFNDHVIVCDYQKNEYFSVEYHRDDTDKHKYLFGDPSAVEQEWVPAERACKAVTELRSRADSYEAGLSAWRNYLCEELVSQFGYNEDGCRKFYLVETYTDHVIACGYDAEYNSTYVNIPFTLSDKETEKNKVTFGEPKAVELDWVASERAVKAVTEKRALAETERNAATEKRAVEKEVWEKQARLRLAIQ